MNSSPPLIKAVETKNIVECRRLIDTGEANINENKDWVGNTAIHIASMEGRVEIAVCAPCCIGGRCEHPKYIRMDGIT